MQEQELTVNITSIDMTSAFDTINRNELIKIAEQFMNEDEIRILHILLTDTTLEIKMRGAKTKPFISNIGSPQGDRASGPCFTTYLENSLRKIREKLENEPIQIEEINEYWIEKRNSCLPNELIYADDCDFVTEEESIQKATLKIATDVLKENNLLVNEGKTEVTILKRGDNQSEEGWRNTIKLGSLLGDKEDIRRRKQLSCTAMRNLSKLWYKKNLTTLKTRLRLYETLVKSILLYNASTWGLTINDDKELDSFHRRQLREIVGIKWPHKIRNKKLYEITKSKPISVDITERRWKMLGHTLRMPPNTPARRAMKYFFEKRTNKKFRGRKRATIITTINRDISTTKKNTPLFVVQPVKTEVSLHNIRTKAKNRKQWMKIVKQVVDSAYSEKSL